MTSRTIKVLASSLAIVLFAGLSAAEAQTGANPFEQPATGPFAAAAAPTRITFNPKSGAYEDAELAWRINQVMKQKPERFTVVLSPATVQLPLPVGAVVQRVARSNGQVRVRTLTLGATDILAAVVQALAGSDVAGEVINAACGAVLPRGVCNVFSSAASALKDRAKRYNVVVVMAKQGDNSCVVAAEFYRRGSAAWVAAENASQAVALDTEPSAPTPGTAGAALTPCGFQPGD